MTDSTDAEDYAFLRNNAQEGIRQQLPNFLHLDQPIGLWNYVRIANDIQRRVAPAARVLDWGCGMGQMTYLMKRRGLSVTSYDVRDPGDVLPDVPLTHTFDRIVSHEPTQLPFDDHAFDAVLSCGVLEHVDEFSAPGNENKSLREIARVLKRNGLFLIYQLPQHAAWQESIIRRLKLGYAHPRRYRTAEIAGMLKSAGFVVQSIKRANLIPKNLTGMPRLIRRAYSTLSRPLIAADGVIAQTPVLRNLAGVFEIVAEKR
jgi:ubiquinone/menaquinone biosynthesis C-methylase UbiE